MENQPDFEVQTFKRGLSAARRHWLLAFTVFLLSVLAAGAITAYTPPLYRAKASVLIENKARKIVTSADSGSVSAEVTKAQRSLAESRPVLTRAAEFAAAQIASTSSGSPVVAQDISEEEQKSYLNKLFNGANTSTATDGQLLNLEVLNADPDMAALAANAWGTAFVEEMTQRERSANVYTRDFLEKQLPDLRTDWTKKQDALQKFMTEQNFDPKQLDQNPIIDRYMEMGKLMTEAQIKVSGLKIEQTSWNLAKTNFSIRFQHPRARNDAIITGYAKMIQDERRRLIEIRQVNVPGSVPVKNEEELLAELEALARVSLESVDEQFTVDLDIAESNQKMVNQLYTEAKTQYDNLKAKAFKYQMLSFEADMARKYYEELAMRQREAEMAGRVDYSYAQPWERAEAIRSPFLPNWRKNILIGVAIGLMLAIGIVFLIESLDDTIKTVKNLEERVGFPVLGTVPLLERRWAGPNAYFLAKNHPKAPPVEDLRTLRSTLSVGYQATDGRGLVVLVTSALEGEGKSFVSSNLGLLWAGAGKRTLLIDLDCHKATLSKSLNAHSFLGLNSLVSGPRTIQELAIPIYPGLAFVPAGKPVEANTHLLESAAFAQFLEDARNQYDVIIMDSPPVLAVADSTSVAEKANLVLVIVRSRFARNAQVDRATEILTRAKAKEMAFVLNAQNLSDAEETGYGYYYKGKYGYGYGYGYGQSQKDEPATQENKGQIPAKNN